MKDRIAQILKTKNITATQFADELNVQRSGISHILSGRNNPSLDFIMKIKETYPEFNLEWLILGKGPATGAMPSKEIKSNFVPDLFAQDHAPAKEPKIESIESLIVPESKKMETTNSSDETQNKKAPSLFEKAFEKDQPRKIIRLITLYDDNTFDSYEPSVH
jgi:transcriptional regulator with XRE-family HTH domain